MSNSRAPEHATLSVRKRLRLQPRLIRMAVLVCPLGLVPLVVLLAFSKQPSRAVLWLLIAWVIVLLVLVLATERGNRRSGR